MLKLFYIFILITNVLYANQKVEIYSSSITSKDNIVHANDGVTVVYEDYFLTAKRAIYNKDNGDLELFDNILLNNKGKYKLIGSYAKLNIAQKEKLFKPFYMIDKKSKVWISSDEGKAKDQDFDIKSGMVSGCNPIDPLWTMKFSSSDYNANSKWINLYNARIYLYDIPVFYTPWFGYSLDTRRRTGLLPPSLGLSQNEGFYYQQSLYIAESNWWDLELTPQIRTKRGSGIYSTFRFVDSAVSQGELKMGYFKEKQSYFSQQNLQNDSHFGFNFKYNNSDVLNQWFNTQLEGQSGLYMDLNHMNDVDYINLSSNQPLDQSTATQVLSRINMFYNTDEHYIGTYFKYYQDLTLASNSNTPQKLPTLHYHNYLDTLLDDHFLYSLDVQSNNIQRESNKKVIQTDINVPLTLQTNVFDEFLNLSYTANIYAQHSTFSGQENRITGFTYNDGYILKNTHTLAASTQLTKAYDTLTHVIGFGLNYTRNGSESRTGFYQDNKDFCSDVLNQTDPRCEFYTINDTKDSTQLDFTQYLYDVRGKQILYHRLSQLVNYNATQSRYGELENELEYAITDFLSYYNNIFYNYDKNKLSQAINTLTYNDYGFNIYFSHLFKDSFIPATITTPRYTSYLTSSIDYLYSKHYSYSLKYNYDFEFQQKKSAEIGFLYKKRCWEFGIKLVENNRPILATNGLASSVYDRYIYFTITLKPFMQPSSNSSAFSYKLSGS